jgi:hypothetical protein
MGMFDSIYWEKKLPLPTPVNKLKINWKKREFQTKDLECLLYKYKVSRSGQLFILKQETEWVQDDSRFGGYLNVISEKWQKSSYTGTVVFYTTICSNEGQKHKGGSMLHKFTQDEIDNADGFDYFLDFSATFINGKVDNIKFVSIDAEPIREYLINHNDWVDAVNKKQSKISYKVKNFLRKNVPFNGYISIIKILSKFVNFQQEILHHLRY